MEHTYHRFSELFAQLGLPTEVSAIGAFITQHSPLPAATRLEDAPFWTTAQATLLREELLQDADWAETIDQLNAALRH